MRGYEVNKGTRGLLLQKPRDISSSLGIHDCLWDTVQFATTQEHLFCGEEMIVDPTRIYNGTSGISPHSTPYKLAERGYMVFTNDPDNRQKYLLAIPMALVGIR